MDAQPPLESAIEVFARAFAQTRSRTYPQIATFQNNIWALHDEPHRPKARAAELITSNLNPQDHIQIGDQLQVPRWHSALILTPEQEPQTLKSFKDVGFRRIAIEPFFTLNPKEANLTQNPHVKRINSLEEAELVRLANRGRAQISPEHLTTDNAPVRLYAAIYEGKAIGWVSAYKVEGKGSWVANLAVVPEHRNQGLGAALMSALLADDARLKTPLSVLASSNLGAHLYPKLGYNQIAIIHVLRPPNYPRKPRELCL